MNRRHLALAAVAVAAGAVGVGWRQRQDTPSAPSADAHDGLWARRFEQPDGRELTLSSLRGQPLVINFWATWCPPCVKEMPELDRFHRAYSAKGWQVLGLAVDRPEPVRDFLTRHPVGFRIALAGLEGTEISRQLGNTTGALPFTAIFDRQGRLKHRKLGETSFAELADWADRL